MSKLSSFVLQHDRKIVTGIVSIVPILILSIAFFPIFIENYTFNGLLNGQRDNYVSFFEAFKTMQLIALIFVITCTGYNLLRRALVKDIVDKTGHFITNKLLLILTALVIIMTAIFFTGNRYYKNANIEFISSNLIEIKKMIQDGKCEQNNISECINMKKKIPGIIYTTISKEKDNTVSVIKKGEPDSLLYVGYFTPFCISLADKDSPLYTEFSKMDVNGVNPLSEAFNKSSCTDNQNVGSIILSFK